MYILEVYVLVCGTRYILIFQIFIYKYHFFHIQEYYNKESKWRRVGVRLGRVEEDEDK